MINLFLIVHEFSGAKTYVEELSKFLVKQKDIHVFQIFLNHTDTREFTVMEKNDMTLIFIPEKIKMGYEDKYYKRAAKLLFFNFQNIQNVVIHANMPEQYLFVKELSELYRCHIVFTLHFLMSYYSYYDRTHGNDNYYDKGNILESKMLELADHIICVTKFGQRAITKIRKINPDKTTVIYNGISIINPHNELSLKVRSKYGFLAKDILILYAGQLEPRKGIDKLINAFLLVKDEFPNSKLIIAGQGDYDNYLPLATECIGRICFTGKLEKNVLNDFYQFAEIGIIPSQYEQCSYVAIEMMQSGLPIVISDVPGLNELVIPKINGLLCKTKMSTIIPESLEVDEENLAKQIRYLIKNKKTRLKFAQASKLKVQEIHALEGMGTKTLSIYRSFLEQKAIQSIN